MACDSCTSQGHLRESLSLLITPYDAWNRDDPEGSKASQVALVVKNPPANARGVRDEGSISGSGRSPGGGHGIPLQYSCGESHGQRSLVGYSPWGCKELDLIEMT